MRTIRFQHPEHQRVHLGLLDGNYAYSITEQVPAWTDPMPMWRALRALGVTVQEAEQRLAVGTPLDFAALEREDTSCRLSLRLKSGLPASRTNAAVRRATRRRSSKTACTIAFIQRVDRNCFSRRQVSALSHPVMRLR